MNENLLTPYLTIFQVLVEENCTGMLIELFRFRFWFSVISDRIC